ncbi:Capsular polysaccharide biosynthesis protein [Sharpea azabuensis]|uniref:YveK family protein n=1 Tax=Sharpea azabuensis TaxID=322505 RepID=UPI0008E3A976|nr:Wzz/FepE/Etk N-terminal domain-containing protein [Sharpea azabuensis]SFD55206.1 Capsular polysaccharide biosynthesis protein [Sharpea azabuensis]SFK55564.1 Capsular polysaccharide biosynthesis protein [Sharpea azabuensis]
MDNNFVIENNNEEEVTIDLMEILKQLKSHIRSIILTTLLIALLAGVITVFVIPKKYESTVRLYLKPDSTTGVSDYSQVNANNLLVNNYVEMIKGNNITEKAATALKINQGVVSSSLVVTNETNTQVISITSKTTDPALSKRIVDQVTKTFRDEVRENLNVTNITIIDNSKIATSPVSPSLPKNLAIGALAGAVLSIAVVIIRMLMDTRIHNKDEAEQYLGIPNLGAVPFIENK